ncbi:MAG: M48 family metallopeptidase [Myxococcota bacterium]|nr:M48 family metallopeptidase [Myxococcota bacterium]
MHAVTSERDCPYPPGPAGVPAELTAASAAYKRSAWLAFLGLAAFIAVYLGMTGYLAWVVYRLLGDAILHGGNVPLAAVLVIPALFFLAFLVRGLFVIQRAADRGLIELHEESEPRLFAFLRRLADETGAPRPHRVFLSARVNAAVFYDLSFSNLIFPTKKNLELGLGLVNVLSLDELKAVVAHEYGHFAQRTMAVGRWVYIAQQIAGHVVASRGGFDRVLAWISRFDLRIAWIGWIMRLFVWAIRAVLDTFLRIVILAHRALSREMELQADRVAVSVTGSDSLIHALHRLGPADEAWEEAVRFVADEAHAGRSAEDLFAVQTAALDHLRRILDEPELGRTPVRPDRRAGEHRVFDTELAQPPRMWSTHPPNREREDWAKAVYLASALDERPAWALFADPARTRRTMTERFFELAIPPKAGTPASFVSTDASLAKLEERFLRAPLDPRYRGAYLGRAVAAYHHQHMLMIGMERDDDRDRVLTRLAALYPATLREELARYREQRREEALLEGLELGVLTAPGGIIKHRGREIPRKRVGEVLELARAERRATEARIVEHDRRCRAAHLDAARLLGEDWESYLESLIALLHYATHTERNVADAIGHLHHVLDIVFADGHVSDNERRWVLDVTSDLQTLLERVWRQRRDVVLPPAVKARFDELGGFVTLSQSYGMGSPHPENLGDWLAKIDGWALGATGDLQALADATLDALLDVEEAVAKRLREQIEPGEAPEPARCPAEYDTCVVGAERERQKKLGWWDRFQTADGFFPGAARFAVASAVLLPALFLGGTVGSSTIHVHNGLSVPVVVAIDGDEQTVRAYSTLTFEHDHSAHAQVLTTTLDGRTIESFEADTSGGFGTYAYDVAGAAALVEWTAIYGPGLPPAPRVLGARRWMRAEQDFVFEEPPRSVTSRGATRRTVLTALSDQGLGQLEHVTDPTQRAAMIAAHLAWEPSESPAIAEWLAAANDPTFVPVIRARAAAEPDAVVFQRALQDVLTGAEHDAVCAQQVARAAERPGDPGRRYLAIRCMPDQEARGPAFVEASEAHPTHGWLAFGAAREHARHRRWAPLLATSETAYRDPVVGGGRSYVAIELVRARRAARHAGASVGSDTQGMDDLGGSQLEAMLALEGAGLPEDGAILRAYRQLLRGDPDAAVAVLDSEPSAASARPSMIAAAAASDGASEALLRRAATILEEPIDPIATLALTALAVREHWRAHEVFARVAALDPSGALDDLVDVLMSPTLADDPSPLLAIADRCDLFFRGQVLAMGLVVLGDRAPIEWRAEARALLFATERPFFR